MTTHRKALARVGVAAVAVLGSLVVAGPAHAAGNVEVTLTGQPTDFSPGQTQTLKVKVNYTASTKTEIAVSVTGLNNFTVGDNTGCDGGSGSDCTINFTGANSRTVSFDLKAPGNVDPGQSKTDHIKVTATATGLLVGSDSKTVDATVKVAAPTQAPTVTQVTGTVKDATTGAVLKNALVGLGDNGACAPGKTPCQTGTDDRGAFKFTPSPDKPIMPGSLVIAVAKDGYETLTRNVQAQAGQSVSVVLAVKPTAVASTSASPEALPSADGQAPTADAGTQAAAAPGTQKAASNSGLSMFSWIILALAIVLVLAGVGVFVMLFVNRRKRDAEDEGDGGNPSAGPGDGPTGPGGGGYGAADPTMVGHPRMAHAMGAPGASDATAIIHPARPEDEFPDPYAAPYPTNMPGYPPAGNGYGAPTQVGGYAGGQPGGYDPNAQQGYGGAPTAMYGPGGEQAYGGQPGYGGEQAYGGQPGYGGEQAYGDQPGYGGEQPYNGQPGYGGEQAYGAPGSPAAPRYDEATRHWEGEGYPAPGAHSQQGGYEQQQGYGQQQGYEQQQGYDQQQQGGYDPRTAHDQRGGYEQGGGYDAAGYPPAQDPYYQEEPPAPAAPQGSGRRAAPPSGRGGDRQQLNWLDD